MRIQKKIERWFEFENDPDGGKVLIEHLTDGEIRDIVAEVGQTRIEYRQGESEPVVVSSPNSIRREEKILCRAVKDWENHYDEDGNLMDCTDENKIRAMQRAEGFYESVCEFRERLAADVKKERERLEKN